MHTLGQARIFLESPVYHAGTLEDKKYILQFKTSKNHYCSKHNLAAITVTVPPNHRSSHCKHPLPLSIHLFYCIFWNFLKTIWPTAALELMNLRWLLENSLMNRIYHYYTINKNCGMFSIL